MNTEQKARALVALNIKKDIDDLILHAYDAHEIITALLAERQALLDKAKLVVDECRGFLGTEAVRDLEKAIAICEEQNSDCY